MILAKGKLWDSRRQGDILRGLEAYINRVRATKTPDRGRVIDAVSELGRRLGAGEFDPLLRELVSAEEAERIRTEAALAMRREALAFRCAVELGDGRGLDLPLPSGGKVRARAVPLGTLLHIAAGNADGLAAFSVLEGLLTGNFNIVKLPSADNGLTVAVLRKLIEIEPQLADFVAVFDTPSADADAIRTMADMADGIVVWGGDEAVRAVRALASPGVKLIEWGHRLGFAYLADWEGRQAELAALASHIMETRQLLCSSCQVIYLDTEKIDDCVRFAGAFLPMLEAAAKAHPPADIGQAAQIATRARCSRLERAVEAARPDGRGDGKTVFEGEGGAAVTVCADSLLELSPLYGSVLVKRLPEKHVLPVLRQAKGRLQTAGLVAEGEKRRRLTELFIRAGVNRVLSPARMSAEFTGGAHDGEYPLRRYVRIVNIEE